MLLDMGILIGNQYFIELIVFGITLLLPRLYLSMPSFEWILLSIGSAWRYSPMENIFFFIMVCKVFQLIAAIVCEDL